MEKINRLLFFTSLLIIAGVFGCNKKPLDQKPTGEYTNGNFWRNQDDVIAGITGIYNDLYVEDGLVITYISSMISQMIFLCMETILILKQLRYLI